MKAIIYKQSYDTVLDIVDVDPYSDMFSQTTCIDCQGTGVNEIPSGEIGVVYEIGEGIYVKETCVRCRGTKKEWVSLY